VRGHRSNIQRVMLIRDCEAGGWHWAGGTYLSVRDVNREGGTYLSLRKLNVQKNLPLLGIEPRTSQLQEQGPKHWDTELFSHSADLFFL